MNSSFFFLHSGLKQAPWYFSWPRQPPSAPCLPSPWGGVQQRETQPKFSARLKALEIRASCKELLCIWLALSPTRFEFPSSLADYQGAVVKLKQSRLLWEAMARGWQLLGHCLCSSVTRQHAWHPLGLSPAATSLVLSVQLLPDFLGW